MQDPFAVALNSVARDLREARIDERVTQAGLARRLGRQQQNVSELERAALKDALRPPQLPLVLRYARALGRTDAEVLRAIVAKLEPANA